MNSLTISQDEESCVVYGMPRKAVEWGAVDEVRNLEEIVRRLIELR
jgi:two-component system chemotaxis response regulator CheB